MKKENEDPFDVERKYDSVPLNPVFTSIEDHRICARASKKGKFFSIFDFQKRLELFSQTVVASTEGQLSFNKDDLITVIYSSKNPEKSWKGYLNGVCGEFNKLDAEFVEFYCKTEYNLLFEFIIRSHIELLVCFGSIFHSSLSSRDKFFSGVFRLMESRQKGSVMNLITNSLKTEIEHTSTSFFLFLYQLNLT